MYEKSGPNKGTSSAVWVAVVLAIIVAFFIGRQSGLPVNGPTPPAPLGTPGQPASGLIPAFNLECGVALGPDLREYTNTKQASFVMQASCQSGIVMLPRYTKYVAIDASVPVITRYYFKKEVPAGGNGTPLEGLESVPVASNGPGTPVTHVEKPDPVGFSVLNQQPVAVIIKATFN